MTIKTTIQTPQAFVPSNAKDADLEAWRLYKRSPTPENRQALLKRFSGVIHGQVNKWSGPVSRDVLLNEAKVLAIKAFDSYNPNGGAALSTHVTNAIMPISRIVYTYQNAARMPENIAMKVSAFNSAVSEAKDLYGREPTTDELHSTLGWSAAEINRMREYNHKDLIESGPAVSGEFFSRNNNTDDMLLGGLYMELTPEEKQLFEMTTGYNRGKPWTNADIIRKLGITQSQLSYRKTSLRNKVESILNRPSVQGLYGR